MHTIRPACLATIFCFASVAALAQQTTSAPTQAGPQTAQAASILQQSLTAMTGGAALTDVTMSGTITTSASPAPDGIPVPAGGADSGSVTFVATSAGRGMSTIKTGSGTRTEIRDVSSGTPTLTVKGTDGTTYSITTQSAVSPYPGWFYPALLLSTGVVSGNYASSYVGPETWNGAPAQHVAVWLLPNAASAFANFPQQVTQHDIYLNPTSLLPLGMTFIVHPYDPAAPNRPLISYRGESIDSMEYVTFSNYQQVQGRLVPFHIQTSLRAGATTISADIQLSSISINTGATVTAN